jgi:tetratricopeptide (TPR) repeat protein
MVLTGTHGDHQNADQYSELFQGFVANGLEAALDDLKSAEQSDALDLDRTRRRTLNVLDFSLRLVNLWPRTRDVLSALSPLMEREGHWVEWQPFLLRALEFCQRLDDRSTYAECALYLGLLFRSLANYSQARVWLQTAQDTFLELGDHRMHAQTLYRRAQVERLDGRLDAAKALAQQTLSLWDPADPDRGGCYTILGAIAYDRQAWQESEQYFQKALEARRKGKDTHALAWAYADVAAVFRHKKRYAEAIANYEHALALYAQAQGTAPHAIIQLNLSAVYLSAGQPELALQLCLELEPLFRRIHDVRRLTMVKTNVGIAYRDMAQWQQAETAFSEAIGVARKHGFYHLLTNALDQLGTVFLMSSCPSRALALFDQAIGELSRIEDQATQDAYRQIFEEHKRTAETAIK